MTARGLPESPMRARGSEALRRWAGSTGLEGGRGGGVEKGKREERREGERKAGRQGKAGGKKGGERTGRCSCWVRTHMVISVVQPRA